MMVAGRCINSPRRDRPLTRGADVVQRTCSIPKCVDPVLARDWCRKHYTRWYYHDDPLYERPKVCMIPGCIGPVSGRGWCKYHYQVWSQHGDPLYVYVRHVVPVAARLWPRVETNYDNPGWGGILCREWQGYRSPRGYGGIHVDKRCEATHRVAWIVTYGPIPDEMPCVLHHCDNPPCCEPTHLFLGTKADNVADMMAKGRHHKGGWKLPPRS